MISLQDVKALAAKYVQQQRSDQDGLKTVSSLLRGLHMVRRRAKKDYYVEDTTAICTEDLCGNKVELQCMVVDCPMQLCRDCAFCM